MLIILEKRVLAYYHSKACLQFNKERMFAYFGSIFALKTIRYPNFSPLTKQNSTKILHVFQLLRRPSFVLKTIKYWCYYYGLSPLIERKATKTQIFLTEGNACCTIVNMP